MQCDGYAAYPSFARDKQHLELVGCWAHVRRRFYEARPHVPLRATWILRQIAHLYHLEQQLRDGCAGPKLRAAHRASQAAPILARLHRVLRAWKTSGDHLPASSMGQAIDYALGQWDLLGGYLHDGRLEIDNNQVENAIRPTAVGINPFDYLKDVLTQIPHHTNKTVAQLTPENWLKNRQTPAARAA